MLTGSMPKNGGTKWRRGGKVLSREGAFLVFVAIRYVVGWRDKKCSKALFQFEKNLGYPSVVNEVRKGHSLCFHRIFPLSNFDPTRWNQIPERISTLLQTINPSIILNIFFFPSFLLFPLSLHLKRNFTKYYIYRDKKIMWQAWHDTVSRNNLYRYTLHEFN